MDILLTAILGALTKLTEQGVMDAYQGLKDLLKRKLGGDSDLVAAVEALWFWIVRYFGDAPTLQPAAVGFVAIQHPPAGIS